MAAGYNEIRPHSSLGAYRRPVSQHDIASAQAMTCNHRRSSNLQKPGLANLTPARLKGTGQNSRNGLPHSAAIGS